MLENSKMLPLPANVDCNAQSTFSQRSVNVTVNVTVNVAKMLAGAAFWSFKQKKQEKPVFPAFYA